MNSYELPTLMKLPEVALLLRISARTMRRYIAEGTIPPHLYSRTGGKPKGSFRFTQDQVRIISEHLWSTPEPAPALPDPAPARTGMVPYRPRRRVG
jgi:hypothetical protein